MPRRKRSGGFGVQLPTSSSGQVPLTLRSLPEGRADSTSRLRMAVVAFLAGILVAGFLVLVFNVAIGMQKIQDVFGVR